MKTKYRKHPLEYLDYRINYYALLLSIFKGMSSGEALTAVGLQSAEHQMMGGERIEAYKRSMEAIYTLHTCCHVPCLRISRVLGYSETFAKDAMTWLRSELDELKRRRDAGEHYSGANSDD